jgi:hypothetical protein
MPADLALIGKTWQSLQPALAEEKCAGCECLAGALVELRLTLEELPTDPEQTEMLAQVSGAFSRGERHACLGCQPCNPGDILANFYRDRQAQETAPQTACCDG